jgi:hypothetical protein
MRFQRTMFPRNTETKNGNDLRELGLVLGIRKAFTIQRGAPLPPYNMGISRMSCHAHSPHVCQFGGGKEALLVLDERAALQFCHGLPQLLLGVHHDRTVPRDRFLNRLARYQ